MKESQTPHKLYYQNDDLSMAFYFYLEGLWIEVTNKTNEPIKINWDEIRMTENETNKKIEHLSFKSLSEGDIVVYQPPLIISPKSVCTDFVVYADNIYYLKEPGNETMKIKNMYPREVNKNARDSILNLKGQRITLLIPSEIKNVSHSWVFNFLLEDIKSKRPLSDLILPY